MEGEILIFGFIAFIVLIALCSRPRHHEPTVVVITNPDDYYHRRGLGCGFELMLLMIIGVLVLIVMSLAQ